MRALNGLGNVAALSDSATAARMHMRQAIDLARRTGNAVGLGHALTNAGIWVSALSGAFEEATNQLQEGLDLARARETYAKTVAVGLQPPTRPPSGD